MINSDYYWSLHARLNTNTNAKQLRKQLGGKKDEEE
jgi:hypothetical protein